MIGSAGELEEYVPYSAEELLIVDVDPTEASRSYAKQFDPDLYPEY